MGSLPVMAQRVGIWRSREKIASDMINSFKARIRSNHFLRMNYCWCYNYGSKPNETIEWICLTCITNKYSESCWDSGSWGCRFESIQGWDFLLNFSQLFAMLVSDQESSHREEWSKVVRSCIIFDVIINVS